MQFRRWIGIAIAVVVIAWLGWSCHDHFGPHTTATIEMASIDGRCHILVKEWRVGCQFYVRIEFKRFLGRNGIEWQLIHAETVDLDSAWAQPYSVIWAFDDKGEVNGVTVYGHCQANSSYGPFIGMTARRDPISDKWTVDVSRFGPPLSTTQQSP